MNFSSVHLSTPSLCPCQIQPPQYPIVMTFTAGWQTLQRSPCSCHFPVALVPLDSSFILSWKNQQITGLYSPLHHLVFYTSLSYPSFSRLQSKLSHSSCVSCYVLLSLLFYELFFSSLQSRDNMFLQGEQGTRTVIHIQYTGALYHYTTSLFCSLFLVMCT